MRACDACIEWTSHPKTSIQVVIVLRVSGSPLQTAIALYRFMLFVRDLKLRRNFRRTLIPQRG
jgi:hypothetical protein